MTSVLSNCVERLGTRHAVNGGSVDSVILAGTVGNTPGWTCGLPKPLVPIPGGRLIDQLLERLMSLQGATAVCANGNTDKIAAHLGEHQDINARIRLVADKLPRGTAGCLDECRALLGGDVFLVVSGGVFLDDDPKWMVAHHRSTGHAVTVFCRTATQANGAENRLKPAGLFVCDREVLDFIPDMGYLDLKEQLIPALQRAGRTIGAARLRGWTREITTWDSYLQAFENLMPAHAALHGWSELAPQVWCGADVRIAASARIYGPVAISSGCVIENHATIIGPAYLAPNTQVRQNSFFVRSVVWSPSTAIASNAVIVDRLYAAPNSAGDPVISD